MTIKIAVIPGDGIGGEVISIACEILSFIRSKADLPLTLDFFDWGADRYLRDGISLPEGTIELLRNNYQGILFGCIGDPRIKDLTYAREILLGLRRGLNLCVNYRPISFDFLQPNLDQVIPNTINVYRENTQCLYQGIGGNVCNESTIDVAIDTCVYTREKVHQFLDYCFNHIVAQGGTEVTLVHKSNAVPNTGKLWQDVFYCLGKKYPKLKLTDEYVDSFCYKFIIDAKQYANIVTSNLFGDIISDIGAALMGGIGFAPSANINPLSKFAMYEPVHGSAPDIAGKGIASPVATLMSVVLMLDQFGFKRDADVLRASVIHTHKELNKRGTEVMSNEFLVCCLDKLKSFYD